MTGIIQITIAAALILSIILPFGAFFLGEKNKKRYKTSLGVNCFLLFWNLTCGNCCYAWRNSDSKRSI